jgi:hypothetical protein
MAIKDGWWIQINTSKTECSQITFAIGTDGDNRRFWTTWNSGDPEEFDVPIEYRQVSDLYIQGTVHPEGKNGWFCMKFKGRGVKHFDFDGDEDHKQNQSDDDDECR